MNLGEMLQVLLILATALEEGLEATLGKLFDTMPVLVPYKGSLFFVNLALGVALVWLLRMDVLPLALPALTAPPALGITLTGLLVGGGSKAVHYAMEWLKAKSLQAKDRLAKG